jgi:hypothetical protein
MGYTNYWSYDPQAEQFQEAWPKMVADAQRIAERAGVPLGDGLGEVYPMDNPMDPGGRPEFGPDRIWLNGVERDSHETLLIEREPSERPSWPGAPGGDRYVWAFCKTARKPYDLVVGAILLRCAQLAPDAFVIGSDGEWNSEWKFGAEAFNRPRLDPTPPAPGSIRRLVADLFGSDECPGSSELGRDPRARSTTEGPPSAWDSEESRAQREIWQEAPE